MSQQQQDAASRDTSNAVQLFQDAHQKMVMLKRVDEQMAQLVQRKRTLMEELRHVQAQINGEFERMFDADPSSTAPAPDMSVRLRGLSGSGNGAAASREGAFAEEAVLADDEA